MWQDVRRVKPSGGCPSGRVQAITFHFEQVGPGQNSLCIQVVLDTASSDDQPFVDTCQWVSLARTVNITAGHKVTGFVVTAQKGALLRVRVNDLDRLNRTGVRSGATAGRLRLTLRGDDELYQSLHILSEDAAGQDYGIVVPVGRPLRLSVASDVFSIVDDTGKNAAGERPVTVMPGTKPASVQISLRSR